MVVARYQLHQLCLLFEVFALPSMDISSYPGGSTQFLLDIASILQQGASVSSVSNVIITMSGSTVSTQLIYVGITANIKVSPRLLFMLDI